MAKAKKKKAAKKTAKKTTRRPPAADQAIAAIASAQASKIRSPRPAAQADAKTKRRPGRPRGPAAAIPVVKAEATRCPVCRSTKRTRYTTRQAFPYPGLSPFTGEPCNKVIHRRTTCADCGQVRTDHLFVNEKDD